MPSLHPGAGAVVASPRGATHRRFPPPAPRETDAGTRASTRGATALLDALAGVCEQTPLPARAAPRTRKAETRSSRER